MRPNAQDRSFSLLEVTIAVSLLGVLMVAGASIMVTLQRGTAVTAALLDLDQAARRVVGQLRSEIRQSGHHQDDVDGANQNYLMVTGTLDQTNMNDQVILECYMRTYIVTGTLGAALDSTYSPSDPAGPTTAEGEISRKASWGRAIRYRLIPGTSIPSPTGPLQLYTLVQDVWVDQPQNGYDVGDGDIQASEVISGLQVCDGVREMTVNLTGASAEVVMTLAKTNPDWSTLVNGAPEPLGVVVRERVQMQNAANGEWDTAEVTATAPSWP